MSRDRDAFLTSILSAPADDAPRLVYADWLDGVGDVTPRECIDHERAEFIRVQVELAKPFEVTKEQILTGIGFPRPFAEPQPALRRRSSSLLGAHLNDWFAAPCWAGFVFLDTQPAGTSPEDAPDAVVRRGFVESVTMDASSWLQWGDSLSWSPEQTAECPQCSGWPNLMGPPCGHCRGTGRAPRPMPATAQPLATVSLTSRPLPRGDGERSGLWGNQAGRMFTTGELNAALRVGDDLVTNLLRCRWPAVEKWHLPPEP